MGDNIQFWMYSFKLEDERSCHKLKFSDHVFIKGTVSRLY